MLEKNLMVNIQITMACTRAAQQGHISYNMRAHILGAIHGDGTPAAVEEWQLQQNSQTPRTWLP